MANDPLSATALSAVPEVAKQRDAFKARVNHDIVGGWTESDECQLQALEAEYVRAVLAAERTRLLGLTPEAVVEAAAKAMWAYNLRDIPGATAVGTPESREAQVGMWRDAARAALPLLLAPEVARREAAQALHNDEVLELVARKEAETHVCTDNSAGVAHLQQEIERLTAERDEARECLTEALQCIGKVGLDDLNAKREAPNDWPAGQSWDELVPTSQSFCRKRGAHLLGLDYWRCAIAADIPGAKESAALASYPVEDK